MLCENKQCAKHSGVFRPPNKRGFGFFTGILLALLPKCPFCVMAFSSTFVLCGEAGTLITNHTQSSPTTILVSTVFCGIALAGILFNYRNKRTGYALLLALSGSACILISVAIGGGLALYYTGVVFIFCGVWLNGNLFFFVRKIRDLIIKNRIPANLEFK